MNDLWMRLVLLADAGKAEAPPANPAGGQGSDIFSNPLFMMAMVMFAFYLLIIRPQRRESKDKQDLLNHLKKNDKVITIGGLIGVVANVKDDEVTVKIDEDKDVKVRFTKSSIAQVIPAKEADKPAPAGEKATT